MNIRPLPGYCLVEPLEEETKTASGLYTPEMDKDKPSRGLVVATSVDFTDFSASFPTPFIHSPVKVGQMVVYKRFVSQEVYQEGKKHLLIGYNELLAIIE